MDQTRPRLRPVIDHNRLRSGLRSLRDRLPEVRETAESDDGLITVTLGANPCSIRPVSLGGFRTHW